MRAAATKLLMLCVSGLCTVRRSAPRGSHDSPVQSMPFTGYVIMDSVFHVALGLGDFWRGGPPYKLVGFGDEPPAALLFACCVLQKVHPSRPRSTQRQAHTCPFEPSFVPSSFSRSVFLQFVGIKGPASSDPTPQATPRSRQKAFRNG